MKASCRNAGSATAAFYPSGRAGSCWMCHAFAIPSAVVNWLTDRKEWRFFAVLTKADAGLAAAWWAVLLLRGVLPAIFAIAMGALVGAVQSGSSLAAPLAVTGVIFGVLPGPAPIHPGVART